LYDRQIGIFDTTKRHDRTYIIDESQTSSNFPGRFGRRDETYIDYVRRCLSENGMSPETTIAWFCPIVWEAPELVKEVGFSNIISDLIDDQRAWATRSEAYSEKIEKSYSDTLEFSDLVFANCKSLANAFSNNADEIYVVPNGAECLLDLPKPSMGRFSFSDRPKIGYVGNLRDRIDWELLHKVVTELTDYQFIFMGPANESENALQLEKHDNVRMLGVVPYNEMIRYLGEIDVAMVPHLRNSLTEKMNPLKVYNYFAAGLPVVSTDIANLGLIGPSLHKANNAEEFINQIVAAVSSPVDTNSALWKSAMQNISWSDRVSKIIDVMDNSLGDDYASNLSRERSRDLAA
jgi:glycosyltransferase involved in cell wall biosynthesis